MNGSTAYHDKTNLSFTFKVFKHMSEFSDEQLMQRVQQGDQQAFKTLVNQHLAPLYRFTRRLLGSDSEAEDIVQDTFLRVWDRANQWQAGQAKLSTWMHSIAHNLCIDSHRRKKFDTVELSETEELSIPTEQSDLHRLELSDQVEKALSVLPERQRAAVVMCYYQGFSNQEAAEMLDINVSALESLLARARRTLRQQLQASSGE